MAAAALVGAGSVLALAGGAATRPAAREAAGVSIDAAASLAGAWRAEANGWVYEEMWMAPAHGQMTGALRAFDAEGKVRMLELLTIREIEGGLEYSLRHFDAEMTPWGSEVTGPMVLRSGESGPLDFTPHKGGETLSGITLDTSEAGRMRATVAFKADTGRAPLVLEFARVGEAP